MSIFEKIKRYGLIASYHKGLSFLSSKYRHLKWKILNAPVYANPTNEDLEKIENDLRSVGVSLVDYEPSPDSFKRFQAEKWFPPEYHGGENSGAWDEKLLEHWISSERLSLANYSKDDIFVDIAAASSPWVNQLRERKGLNAFAIDLDEVGSSYTDFSYYRIENATKTSFANASIRGAALHCAFEMFMGNDDLDFISEASRILKPGGKVIILPLYMHTHYCAYATPEYFDKGYSASDAKEYIRVDLSGVPSSRKYDVHQLKLRILDRIIATGMQYRLLVLRNKAMLGHNIYCHFILEIEK